MKGAPRSASKLSIDPIKRHAPYFQKSTGSNKRTVLNNRTISCIGTGEFTSYLSLKRNIYSLKCGLKIDLTKMIHDKNGLLP